MPERNDPMYYEIDIQDRKSKETRRVPKFCWWSGDNSIAELRRMCDCQLGAFFTSKSHPTPAAFDRGTITNNFAGAQFEYLKHNKCDHKPSKKFAVTRAVLPDERVVDIAA